jgi:hypothetical protein
VGLLRCGIAGFTGIGGRSYTFEKIFEQIRGSFHRILREIREYQTGRDHHGPDYSENHKRHAAIGDRFPGNLNS